MFDFIFNLQFFATAMNINATQNYVGDPYVGSSLTPHDTPFPEDGRPVNSLAKELKDFYDTELLENARIETYYAQFGKKQRLPKGHGGRIEWRKFNVFPHADILVEGIVPDGKKFGMSVRYGTINDYGLYTAITDKLELRAYDPIILAATEELGASAAETQEALIRDALVANDEVNVIYCDNIAVESGAVVSTPTSYATMEAQKKDASNEETRSMLTPKMIAKAVTKMKKNRVPTINGKYVCIVHPSVAEDLRVNSKEWIEAHKYAATTEIFNGEIGELHGVRFIESAFSPVLLGDYKNKAQGATYASFMFGKDAFAIVDPEGGALEMIVHDKSEAGGPLNQWSTLGYKFSSNGATILYPERVIRINSCSPYSDTDTAN